MILGDPPRRVALAALALGVFAQVGQVLVFREVMAVCHGTEILFGIVLAAGLAWTALGTFLGTVLLRRAAGDAAGHLPAVLAGVASASGLVLAMEILLARAMAGWGAAAAGQTLALSHAALLSVAVTAPACVAGGFAFALALRLVPEASFGRLYRAESWGAVLGGLAFTFIIVHTLPPLRAALAAGIFVAAVAGFALRPLVRGGSGDRPRRDHWHAGLTTASMLAAAAVSFILVFLPLERPAQQLAWRGLLPGYEVLAVRDTPYGRVSALARAGTGQVSLFHNGALAATLEPHATVRDSRPLADLVACQHDAPRRALVVGGALGRFPEELARHGLERVDAVEQDPALFALADAYRGGNSGPAVRRVAHDGRSFVRHAAAGEYDLIVIRAGEPDTATVNRYYTAEFFRQCRRCLSEAGVLVLVLPTYGGGADYTGEALAGRTAGIGRALGQEFEEVRAAPIEGFLLAAARHKGTVALDPAVLARRLAARPAAAPTIAEDSSGSARTTPVDPRDYFSGLFGGVLELRESLDGVRTQERIAALEKALAETPAKVNRDEHPVAVAESLALGAVVNGAAPILATILREGGPLAVAVPIGAALTTAVVIVLAAGRGRDSRSRRPALALGAFAAGVFGLAVQVAILAAYQNVRGYVYQEIGGIVACFMAGLAIGARYAPRVMPSATRRALASLAGMIALAAALPWLIGGLSGLALDLPAAAGFWVLALVAGALDGALVPALVTLGADREGRRAGGWVYGFDLVGSALGAVLCGGVWIPLVGMAGAMLAVGGILVAAGLAIATFRPGEA
jgi:spermidine synthase